MALATPEPEVEPTHESEPTFEPSIRLSATTSSAFLSKVAASEVDHHNSLDTVELPVLEANDIQQHPPKMAGNQVEGRRLNVSERNATEAAEVEDGAGRAVEKRQPSEAGQMPEVADRVETVEMARSMVARGRRSGRERKRFLCDKCGKEYRTDVHNDGNTSSCVPALMKKKKKLHAEKSQK